MALGPEHLLEALALTVVLRLMMHAAVLSWLLAARFRAAMVVQVFEIGIALTLAPVVASLVAVFVLT